MFPSKNLFRPTINRCCVTVHLPLVLAACAWSSLAFGQTMRDWTNAAGDDNWFFSSNWSPTGFPASDDLLFIDFGTPTTTAVVEVARGGLIDISDNANVSLGALFVGDVGEGTLAMSGNSTLSTKLATVGADINSVGRANLTGAVSWNLTDSLTIGDAGHGALNITDGASVATPNILTTIIATQSSGTGLVNISGAGSSLSTGSLSVGFRGDGTLHLTNGAGVEMTHAFVASRAGSVGTLIVEAGATLDGTTTFASMDVGVQGVGRMNVLSGGIVRSTDTNFPDRVGEYSSGVGYVVVDGAGSLWEMLSGLTIGQNGSGDLQIRNGGRVQNAADAIVAQEAGSTGHVLITGDGSTWSNSGALTIANLGDAALLVENRGVVESDSGIIGQQADSSGAVSIDGYGSKWINTGTLDVGGAGIAELHIIGGATVSNSAADIGDSSGSLGNVEVRGAGSHWSNGGNLLVGRGGLGHLQVHDGALVTSAGGVVSLSGTSAGSTAIIDGAGSRWNMTNSLQVGAGNSSDGTVVVTGGGRIATAANITIGNGSGSAGHVTASGTGSTIAVGGDLLVGNAGVGDLTIDSGAAATVGGATSIGAAGTLLIDGATLTTGSLSRASGGTLSFTSGTLTVDGGTFQTAGSTYALDSATVATMNFVNAAANNDDGFVVGEIGTAVANFSGGSTFKNGAFATIGNQSGSNGVVNVTGTGSEVTVTDVLMVGDAGTGILNLADGAAAGSDLMVIGGLPGGDGTANLDSGASLNAFDLEMGWNGQGKLAIRGNASATIANNLDVGANGRLELDGGTLQVNNLTSTNGGIIDFKSGILDVDGTATIHDGSSSLLQGLSVPDSGTVQLSGTIMGPVVSQPGSRIEVDGPAAALGHTGSVVGVDLHGQLHVNANTLTLNSVTYSQLGSLTLLRGGTIVAPNGVALGSGDVLFAPGSAAGTIDGKVAAGVGSVIRGAFTLGDANASDGFVSDGVLELSPVNVAATTLLDANQAVLGSRTQLGAVSLISFPSTLVAANGVIVDFGRNIEGYGTVDTPDDPLRPTIINGHAEGADSSHQLMFEGYVKGVGTFNNVTFNGTHAPGLSTVALNAGHINYGPAATLQIELGGTMPGNAYDQINSTGALGIDGTLEVELINGFEPALGDIFEILTAAGGINGTFANAALPALANDRFWNIDYGSNSVTLSVVAPGLAGDFNDDGTVDAADYVLWRKSPGSFGGDPDGYETWSTNFGSTLSSAAASINEHSAVPEPTAPLLLALAFLISTASSRGCSRSLHRNEVRQAIRARST